MKSGEFEAVLVDTDVYSYLLNGKNYASLYKTHIEGKLLCLAFITVGELHFGAINKGWGPKRVTDLKDRLRSVTIIPYDEEVCLTFGRLKSDLGAKGKLISVNDLWIASCAVRHSIPLVTNNLKHFEHVPGLIILSESKAMSEMQAQSKFEYAPSSPSAEPQQPFPHFESAPEEIEKLPAPSNL